MFRILAVLVAALAVFGCTDSSQETIVGTWFDAEDETTVHFFDDGRIHVEDDTMEIRGKYRLLADNQMSLELTQGESEPLSVVVGYDLSGDRLVLTAPDGDTSKMTRVTD